MGYIKTYSTFNRYLISIMNYIGHKILISAYILLLFSITIYSYSQVDLNLTLSSNPTYLHFQRNLTQVGYFNRYYSMAIYIVLMGSLSFSYIYILVKVKGGSLAYSSIKTLIVSSVVVLFFSYPAFSHDIFNYMFDAKIITIYNANPYYHKATDFPLDQWVRFMHWTHRTYPYGPLWLGVTVPFSYIGLGKFIPTLVLFKIMFSLFHIGNMYLIYKITQLFPTKNRLMALTAFALNPLVLTESLLSPHNESVMLFFLLVSIYMGLINRHIYSLIFLACSVGIKFITIVALPLLFIKNLEIVRKCIYFFTYDSIFL